MSENTEMQKIVLIYATPVSEYMWEYAVNDPNKLRIIEKGDLKALIRQGIPIGLQPTLFNNICAKIDRLYPVLIDFEDLTFESGDDILGELPKDLFNTKKKKAMEETSFMDKTNNFMADFMKKSGFVKR